MNKAVMMLAELIGGFESRAWIYGGAAILSIMVVSIMISLLMTVTEPELNEVGPKLLITPESTVQSDMELLMFALKQDSIVSSVSLATAEDGASQIEVELYPDVAAVTGRTELSLREGVQYVQIPPAPPAGVIKTFMESPGNGLLVFAGMGILFLAMLVLIFLGLYVARTSFAVDLIVLEQVGISPSVVRIPFALYGGLIGLFGAILSALIGYSMTIWLPSLGISSALFPELLRAGMIEEMAVRAVVISLLIGIVVCLSMGMLIYRYPKPFSRSLSSSSSAAVSAG